MDFIQHETSLEVPPAPDGRTKLSTDIRKDPTLFESKELNGRAEKFDYFKPAEDETDAVLNQTTPGLLAYKNRTSKAQLLKPIARPISQNAGIPETLRLNSLLSNKHHEALPSLNEKLIKHEKDLIELEKNGLKFSEDPIAYFFKHKDGTGHRFLYMIYSMSRDNPSFSPYQLKKVTHSEITPEYFTMSATGVTHIIPGEDTETVSLDEWVRETAIFNAIRKYAFFSQYFIWKPLKIWKKFVQNQRYLRISEMINSSCFFINDGYFKSTQKIQLISCDDILKSHLLAIVSQKKYRLTEFVEISKKNRELLVKKFNEYLKQVIEEMLTLDSVIRDPSRVVVKETDFQRKKIMNPTLGQLMVINEKIQKEKDRRTKIIHQEVLSFGHFIRVTDYQVLESLAKSCLECWTIARDNIVQDMSAVFQVEIAFDQNGKIILSPNLDTVISTVRNALLNSIDIINNLPRIIKVSSLRPHLREVHGNVDNLFDNGATFKQCVECNNNYKKIENEIIDVLRKSYIEAEKQSQSFQEFFEIFKLGKTWNAEDYIFERGGESRQFDLTKFSLDYDREPEKIVFDPSTEKVISFDQIRHDVEQFKKDELRIAQFRACTVRGALFIDSKALRQELTPIPVKSMQNMQLVLQKLLQEKIDKVSTVFRFCGKRLKKEPGSLVSYVDNCEFVQLVGDMIPYLKNEIYFVDDLFTLMDTLGFSSSRTGEHSRNPLRANLRSFMNDYNQSLNIREQNRDKYVTELEMVLREKAQLIYSYKTQIDMPPQNILKADVDELIHNMKSMMNKVAAAEPEFDHLTRCQRVLGVNFQDLSEFNTVKENVTFQLHVYDVVKAWQEIAEIMATHPFCNIDVAAFSNRVTDLSHKINILLEEPKENATLKQVHEKVLSILNYLYELELLSNGCMHFHHWNRLFEECGQPKAYYAQIKIDEMISLGILDQREKIENIASISQGEAQLEQEFSDISNQWRDVRLPIVESQIKSEDVLILGDLSDLYMKLNDSLMSLNRMLQVPFVQGLKEQITNLSATLENYIKILNAWKKFQVNWCLLSSFFASEDTKQGMPQEATKFLVVRRRWISIVRHTLDNTLLYAVCSFPSLLEILVDNNNALELILSDVLRKIDVKRILFPRLFFLSNAEVLNIFATTDLNTLEKLVSKMFMKVKGFLSHPLDETEQILQSNLTVQNFQRIKLYAMVSDYNESMLLTRNVILSGSIDSWGPVLVETMRSSMQTHISESLYKYKNVDLISWIESVPMYIAYLAGQITYTQNVQECFNNFENNVRSFQEYEDNIQSKIKTLAEGLRTINNQDLNRKISHLIAMFIHMKEQLQPLGSRKPGYSQGITWENKLHMNFDQQTQKVTISCGNTEMDHGLEFWGYVRQFIHTKSTDKAYENAYQTIINRGNALVNGPDTYVQKIIMSNIAAYVGKFIFFAPSFNDKYSMVITRLISGAIASGAWLAMSDANLCSESSLCVITEFIKQLRELRAQKQFKISLGTNEIKINNQWRLLLLTSKDTKSSAFPDPLKTILQPIAVPAPCLEKMVAVKLLANGILNCDVIAQKLIMFVKSAADCVKSMDREICLSDYIKIISVSGKLMYSMVHLDCNKNIQPPSDGNLGIEQLSVCLSLRYFFRNQIDHTNDTLFNLTLYTYFHIYPTIDEFVQALNNYQSNANYELLSYIVKEVNHEIVESESVKKYIVQRVTDLYWMIKNHICTIIYGGPNSGKSTIVRLLQNALAKAVKDEDLLQRVPAVEDITTFDMFFKSFNESKTYGKVCNSDSGPILSFGLMHSYISRLESQQATIKCLRFNGPLDQKTVDLLQCMIASGNIDRIILNTMENYSASSGMKIIIETDSIDLLSPSLIPFVGILPMENLANHDQKELIYNPDIIFTRVVNDPKEPVTSSGITSIKEEFFSISPIVVRYIKDMIKGQSFWTGDFLNFYATVIGDIAPYNALKFFFRYLSSSKANPNNREQIHFLMAQSLFYAFASLIETSQVSQFDQYIRNTFNLDLPCDWVGFEVVQHFWDVYPRPNLISIRISEGKIQPISQALLNESPIIKSYGSDHTPTVDDVSVCDATFLPMIFQSEILIENKQNIIISGNQLASHGNVISFMFKNHPDIIQMKIPISEKTTASEIISFIRGHSSIISTGGNSPSQHTYALIFENLPSNNYNAIEFIRGIATTSLIPQFSTRDPKHLELIPLRNFFIIITVKSIIEFSTRFVSHFYPLSALTSTQYSKMHTFNVICSYFHISKNISDSIGMIAERLTKKLSFRFNFYHLLDLISINPARASPTRKDYLDNIRALLSEYYFFYLHRIQTEEEEYLFTSTFNNVFPDPDIQSLYDAVIKGNSFFYAEIENNAETGLSANFSFHHQNLVREELLFLLSQFNSKEFPKPTIDFYKPVIKQWILLQRALLFPGRNVMLLGDSGTGRFTLTCFVSVTREFEFINIKKIPRNINVSHSEHRQYLSGIVTKAVNNAVLKKKQTVIFLRAESEKDFDFEYLSSMIYFGDFFPYMRDETRRELYTKVAAWLTEFTDKPLQTYQYISRMVKQRVRFVIATESNFLKFSSNFYILRFDMNTVETMEECAKDALANPEFKKSVGELTKALPRALSMVHLDISSRFPVYSTNHFFDFVNYFMFYFRATLEDLSVKHENTRTALDFVDYLNAQSEELNRKMGAVKPSEESFKAHDERIQATFTQKRDMIQSRLDKIANNEAKQRELVSNIKAEIENFKTQLVNIKVQVDLGRGRVKEITTQQLNQMRLIDGQRVRCVGQVLELICTFMKIPALYEPHGRRVLNDPKFVNTILTRIDEIEYSAKIMSNAYPILQSLEECRSEMDQYTPVAGILFDWLKDVYTMSEISAKITDKSSELKAYEVQLEKFLKDVQIEKESINQVNETLMKEIADFEAMIAERQEQSNEYESLCEQRKLFDEVVDQLDVVSERWLQISSQYIPNAQKSLGDNIIFAAYITYFGVMNIQQQEDTINSIIEILDQSLIPCSKTDIMDSIYERIITIHSDGATSGMDNNTTFDTELNWRRILSLTRCPLIEDTDGLMVHFMRRNIKPSKLIFSSISCSNVNEIIVDAMKTGKRVILTDVLVAGPNIEQICRIPFNRTEPYSTVFNGEQITIHPKFKVFLISSTRDISKIPSALTSRVTTIDTSTTSSKGIKDFLSKQFVCAYKATSQIFHDLDRIKVSRAFDLARFEQQMLEVVVDISMASKDQDFVFIDDHESLSSFTRAKECVTNALAEQSITNYDKMKKEYEEICAPFEPCIDLTFAFWIALSRYMPRIRKNHCFVFDNFIDAFSEVFTATDLSKPFDSQKMEKTITRRMIRYAFQQMPMQDGLVMLLIVGILTSPSNKPQQIDELSLHMHDELNNICDMRALTSSTGDIFDQLKFANITSVYPIIMKYLGERFGRNFAMHIPCFPQSAINNASPARPLIVQCAKGAYPGALVMQTLKSRNKKVTSISLCEDPEVIKRALDATKTAVADGGVILLCYSSPSAVIGRVFADILMMMKLPNAEFKLIIICSTLEEIPMAMLMLSNRIQYESFPNIRSFVKQFFVHHQSAIKGSENPVVLKRVSFITALLFACQRAREFLSPIGIYSMAPFNEMNLRYFIDQTSRFIDSLQTFEVPMGNIRDRFKLMMINAACINQKDIEKLETIVDSTLTSSIFEEKVNFEGCSWSLPTELDINGYLRFFEQLPLFPTPAILGMDPTVAELIMNWRYSQWIVKSFAKMARIPPVLPSDVKSRLTSLMALLPGPISLPSTISETPMTTFFIREIEKFNNAVNQIGYQIQTTSQNISSANSIFKDICSSKIPIEWREWTGIYTSVNYTKFFTALNEHREFLSTWKKTMTIPSVINLRHISNVAGLFRELLNEVAFQRSIAPNELRLEFLFHPTEERLIEIGGISLMGGNWDGASERIVASNAKTTPFMKIQQVFLHVVSHDSPRSGNATVPVYKRVPAPEFAELDNFLFDVPVQTTLTQRQLVLTGTAFVCHIHDIFN